ncbi:MAG TPA: C4-type zinc ribbon domain-containing protein [Bacteroidales bacterium]|nr:C4-type zinc ribbon domain-containing protein [Bacteroidales bacterium]
MAKTNTKIEIANQSVSDKLKSLYRLQLIDSEIDRIKIMRGELPLEVQDLEDEIAGLETRILNFETETGNMEKQISLRENAKNDANTLIKKYTEQQNNVRNNREFDSLSKEIEFQTLEIELCDKKIKEHKTDIELKTQLIEGSKFKLEERQKDLEVKKNELESIVSETKIDEEKLTAERESIASYIEPRLLYAYSRIRNNVLNKLAIVSIERDACGGCFNKIPPQRQLDIKSSRKIIPCEYCGRILVDPDILEK